ncbi:hypothetical protein JGS22_025335 [Streptomyces sp. P38-E01]|uniref:Uncharacterized protein n=1 Tax=Streptomyces tardus TaxID=2780544 RepID=A0A949JL99_9ACTN|nr:hypothetical protein [Streptomyces tardus]MBU7600853.1 hypothetical protein [Streptomyces tardus]
MSKLVRRLVTPFLAVAMAFAFAGTASAVAPGSTAHATIVSDAGDGFATGNLTDAAPPAKGEAKKTKAAWSYHITASCAGMEAPIRQGANFWGEANETPSSGTPVECTGGYVQGCGDATNVVGCNWGQGQRIMLSTMVSDFALLAAHEFGHNWYGHSDPGCANWGSAYEVMRPTMC